MKRENKMIRNYFNMQFFGAVIKGTNITKDGNKRLWTSIGNGWYRVVENNNAKETHIWVTDAESYGELRWLNLATFSGEIVSFQGTREIYISGKMIKSEKFAFPKLQDYKAIIAEHEGKPQEVQAVLVSENVTELQEKERQRVTAEVAANREKYFGKSSKVAWSV
jgi:hypothetical protein